MSDPIQLFNQYWHLAKSSSPMQHKSAVCVTTIDSDGFPSSRFVDLKQVDKNGFVFCTALESQKAKHIEKNNKVSLCIWWEHINLQVRVVGQASLIDDALAKQFWKERSQDAKITSYTFKQSNKLNSLEEMEKRFERSRTELLSETLARPENWGGYCVSPNKIEFLLFRDSRLHERQCYVEGSGIWTSYFLQP